MAEIRLCFVLFVLHILLVIPIFAESPMMLNSTSGMPGYGVGYSVQQTADGGYVAAGTMYDYQIAIPSQMIWLIKTDSNGNEIWDRMFGGSRDDIGYSVQQTKDNGYIIAGSTESFGAGGRDAWLIKTDAGGNEIWNRTFGGPGNDWARSVQQTDDGGYIIAGSLNNYYAEHRSQVVWLIKTDASGNKVWDRTFGGPRDDSGYSAQQTNDGGYIITGSTKTHGEGGKSDLWLIKTDENGHEVWEKTFGGQGNAVGYSVQQTRDNGYIIAGSNIPPARINGEAWLIKADFNGNEIWDKAFGGSGDGLDVGKSVQQTIDGGYIVINSRLDPNGETQGIWLIKFDADGNIVWDKIFDGPGFNEGKSVQQTTDGGYILTGSKYLFGAGPNSVVWLIRTDKNGGEIWDKTFNTSSMYSI